LSLRLNHEHCPPVVLILSRKVKEASWELSTQAEARGLGVGL
jgi:hypothetical protein